MCNYKEQYVNGILKYWGEDLLIEALYKNNKLQCGSYTYQKIQLLN